MPTYNEAGNLERLIESIGKTEAVDAVLIVDDDSPDGTGQIADRLAGEDGFVSVIHRVGKLGLGTAYKAGFSAGLARGFTRLVTMDADFSHSPDHLADLLAATHGVDGADLAIGSRYVAGGSTKNWGILRRMISGAANKTAIAVLGLPARDCTSGFRCYKASLLESIDFGSIRSDGYSFLVEALHRVVAAKGKIEELPITFREREHGQSKISRIEILKGALTLLRLRSSSYSTPSVSG